VTPVAALAAPLTPDADEARRALLRELADPRYDAARPTLLDRAAQAVWEWLQGLRFAGVDGAGGLGLVVLLIVVAIVVVVLLVRFGVPRLTRRSAAPDALFGASDDRDSEALRRAAAAAARAGDHTTAVAEQFRAVARALDERGLVPSSPGTTAHETARRAAAVVPAEAEALTAAARAFDEVRYLDRAGTEAAWHQVRALDERLARAAVPA